MATSAVSSKIIAEFQRRTPRSAELAARARRAIPSGVTHDSRYQEPYPIYVQRAAGSRKWDVDGNEYVDYSGGHGALLLGHNHPEVTGAVAQQLALGTHYGAGHELEIRWAEAVCRLVPSAEQVRFTASGTEATLLAVRLARAWTGRPKLLRFAGHFHGWHDHMAFGVGSRFDGTASPGVLPELAAGVALTPAGDLAATEQRLARGDVAAVIVEPTGASWGQMPLLGEFLRGLRRLTQEHGTLLIFDEVITGFRCAPGGAQAVFEVLPDLTTLAKILAGGLPGGAVCGRQDVLGQLRFDSPGEKIGHHGTFNANPLSAAAGVTALEIVETTDACQRANQYAARLRERLNEILVDEGVPWAVYGTFSGFHIYTDPQRQGITLADIESGRLDHHTLKLAPRRSLLMKLRLGMLLHGVEIFSWPGGPTSAVHSEADLTQTAEAFRGTLHMVREEGELD